MIIKLSYTILNAWKQGRYEEATAQYLGKPFPTTPQMELGKIKHEFWEQYVNDNKRLPDELGGEELRGPVTEQKYEKLIPLGEYQILFRGVSDLEDENVITDYKCGLTEPSTYMSGWQLDAYKLLRPDAKIGRYLCFNPYTSTYSVGAKFLSDTDAENALEHIITYGGDMINYLKAQRLLKDYQYEKIS
jgi:hypothetical protein